MYIIFDSGIWLSRNNTSFFAQHSEVLVAQCCTRSPHHFRYTPTNAVELMVDRNAANTPMYEGDVGEVSGSFLR